MSLYAGRSTVPGLPARHGIDVCVVKPGMSMPPCSTPGQGNSMPLAQRAVLEPP